MLAPAPTMNTVLGLEGAADGSIGRSMLDRGDCGLTLALPGTQHLPRSGGLMLRVRAEQLVSRHWAALRSQGIS